jgi:uncharacterized protein
MVKMAEIRKVVRRIALEFHPRRIVLFGSYARGEATEDSDVDLLVVMPFRDRPVKKAVEVLLRVNPPFPVDLLVRTPAAVRRRLRMGDDFTRDILEGGTVLYEAADR